jgi:hypothetical protein
MIKYVRCPAQATSLKYNYAQPLNQDASGYHLLSYEAISNQRFIFMTYSLLCVVHSEVG